MAELSGFRRFSHPAPRRGSLFARVQRGSDLQRGSVVSITTTVRTSTGHSWLYILRAMQKQSYSLWPGYAICTCAIIINSNFYYFDIFHTLNDIYSGKNAYEAIDMVTIAMYFLGACTGSIVCGCNQNTWPGRKTNYVISVILAVSCALMFWINNVAYTIVRFLAGFSYGFIYIALITQIADNVMKTVRGYIAGYLAQVTLLGLILGVAFSEHSWRESYMRLIFCTILIAFPISSAIMTRYLTYEPITGLLKLGLDVEARNVLDNSRGGKIEKSVIQNEIEERKLMLLEDYDEDDEKCCGFQQIFGKGNGITIFWIVLLRLLYIFTTNMYLFILSAFLINEDFNYIVHVVLLFTRLLILVIPQCSIDKLGRKNLLLVSGIGSGVLLIPFVAQCMQWFKIENDLLAIITFGIHIFVALGIDPVQPIYAAEAFPLSKRNGSLAIVICFENIIQGVIAMLLLLGKKYSLEIFLIITPFGVLLLTLILFAKLPETKSMPLRQCRDEFNKNIVKKTLPRRVSGIHTLGTTYM